MIKCTHSLSTQPFDHRMDGVQVPTYNILRLPCPHCGPHRAPVCRRLPQGSSLVLHPQHMMRHRAALPLDHGRLGDGSGLGLLEDGVGLQLLPELDRSWIVKDLSGEQGSSFEEFVVNWIVLHLCPENHFSSDLILVKKASANKESKKCPVDQNPTGP